MSDLQSARAKLKSAMKVKVARPKADVRVSFTLDEVRALEAAGEMPDVIVTEKLNREQRRRAR